MSRDPSEDTKPTARPPPVPPTDRSRIDAITSRVAGIEEEISSRSSHTEENASALAQAVHQLRQDVDSLEEMFSAILKRTDAGDMRTSQLDAKVDAGFALVSQAVRQLEKALRERDMMQAEQEGKLAVELAQNARENKARATHDSLTDSTLTDLRGVVADHEKKIGTIQAFFDKHLPTKSGRAAVVIGGLAGAVPVFKVVWELVKGLQ